MVQAKFDARSQNLLLIFFHKISNKWNSLYQCIFRKHKKTSLRLDDLFLEVLAALHCSYSSAKTFSQSSNYWCYALENYFINYRKLCDKLIWVIRNKREPILLWLNTLLSWISHSDCLDKNNFLCIIIKILSYARIKISIN